MTKNIMWKNHPFIKGMLAIIMVLLSADSVADLSTTNITVNVTIEANNCRVNENQSVSVEFGSVLVDQISKVTEKVPVTIACDNIPASTLSMAINGTASSFNEQALQTDVSDLGIIFSSPQSETLKLNTFYDVSKTFGLTSKTGTFYLTAHLAQNDQSTLPGGEFNASATLVIQIS